MEKVKRVDDARRAYEPILRELLPLYQDTLLVNDSFPPIRTGYGRTPHIAHGWFMRVQRGIEAILRLESVGYTEEAVAISRSVIEHVVALEWLAVDGDEIVDALALGHKHGAEKLLKATTEASWNANFSDEIAAAIASVEAEARDPKKSEYLQFIRRNSKFGSPHTLPGYYATVARVHPTYESAMAYVEVPDHRALSRPKPTVWQAPFCTSELLEALIAYRCVFDPPPWFDELKRVLPQYFAITDRVRSQDGLKPVKWPDSVEDLLVVGD